MKALTLHQPWASLIAAGLKSCETRHWAPHPREWDQVIAIHAGAVESRSFRNHPEVLELLGHDPTPRKAIVAIARLKDCVPTERCIPGRLDDQFGDFSPGRFAWRLTDVQPLSEPLPVNGHHKLWTVPAALVPVIMLRLLPPVLFNPHPEMDGRLF